MKDNFNRIYNNIINESFGRWLNNSIRTNKSKSGMIKEVLKNVVEANGGESTPVSNKAGTAKLWKMKSPTHDGKFIKFKISNNIWDNISSDKASITEFPVKIISALGEKTEKTFKWSWNEKDVCNEVNKFLKDKLDKDQIITPVAAAENAKHASDDDDDDTSVDTDDECTEQAEVDSEEDEE